MGSRASAARQSNNRRVVFLVVVAVVFVVTAVGLGTSSQIQAPVRQPGAQPPVFRSGVQLVEVDAVATDAQGRPVMDLTRDEFELYDEGERQEIAFFAAVALPIQAPRPPVLRDVASNAFAEDGRLFVLVLDDIHSLRMTTPVIKAAARRLVERLSPQDQVAVLWMSTDKGGAFEFTTNHAAVLAAIDEFAAAKAVVERFAGPLFSDPEVEAHASGGPRDVQKFFEDLRPFSMVEDLCRYVARTETIRAVSNVLPQSALPLRGLAVPFRGDAKAKTHPVAIAVEVTASPRDGQPERAEVFAAAVEPGKTLRATQRATATFAADRSRAPVLRYLLFERLDLKPGRYQLRLGVESAWAQATGSVYVDVTVPDFRDDVLSMSGLVLDHRSSAPPIPATRTSVITSLVPTLPSLAREFGPSDAVWAHVEIYHGSKAHAAPVEVVTALGHQGDAEAVWHVRESFPPSAFGAANNVVYRVPLPIAALPPGAYRLRVTATTAAVKSTNEPSTVHREMDITVIGAVSMRDVRR